MFNRAVAAYFQSHYGDDVWYAILHRARLSDAEILSIEFRPRVVRKLFITGVRHLAKTPGELLEDLGAWLVQIDSIRRLLRFSGSTFEEFIESLVEIPDRGRMIFPKLPALELRLVTRDDGALEILVHGAPDGWVLVMAGALRAMADDYGALAVVSVSDQRIIVWIASAQHGTARPFLIHHTLETQS